MWRRHKTDFVTFDIVCCRFVVICTETSWTMKFLLAFVVVLLFGWACAGECARSGLQGKLKCAKDCENSSDEEDAVDEASTVAPGPAPEEDVADVEAALPSVPGPNVATMPVPDVDNGSAVNWPFVARGARPLFPDCSSHQAKYLSDEVHPV